MRITFLKVYTPQFEKQLEFYEEILQLPVKKVSDIAFQVKIGFSVLEFEEDASANPYHIAFHIPAGQEVPALKWLKQRVEILRNNDEEITDFPAWKAKSVYFYDTDKNILEFIAREDLYPFHDPDFSQENILGIAEIGLATNDVEEKYHFLNENFGLTRFSGDYDKFCATGDDEGLLIIIDKNQKDWIPTGDQAYSSHFEIKMNIRNAIFGAVYQNDSLKLL